MPKSKVITVRLTEAQREMPNLAKRIGDYMDKLDVDALAAEALEHTQMAFIYEGAFQPASFEYEYSPEETAELEQPNANKVMQKPIRVPLDLLDCLNDASRRLNMARSKLIRFAISGKEMKLPAYKMPSNLNQVEVHRRQQIINQIAA